VCTDKKEEVLKSSEIALWNFKYKSKAKLPEQQNACVQEIKYLKLGPLLCQALGA
jgi:hypothetical protein